MSNATSGAENLEGKLSELEARLAKLESAAPRRDENKGVCIICFSGEWDKLFASLTIASGALAMGHDVHLFFTFWAVAALRKEGAVSPGASKNFAQKMMGKMLPTGLAGAQLSKMNFGGLGKVMLNGLMKKNGVEDIDSLMKEVREMGAKIHLCETSSGLFGLCKEELSGSEEIDSCGVATFLSYAFKSKVVLFV